MKNTTRAGLIASAVAATVAATAAPALAASSFWTINQTHYTIYTDGSFATMYFSKVSLPANSKVSSTSAVVRPYTNGRTTEAVTVCFQQYGASVDYACTASQNITSTTTIPTSLFNGQDARGTVSVRHTLTGGTYPATGGSVQDTVTVNYTY